MEETQPKTFSNSKKEVFIRKFYGLNSDFNEPAVMNNLNTRFVNFINIVKKETNKRDLLQADLIEKKQEFYFKLKENSVNYYNELMNAKRKLNDLSYELNSHLIKERRGKLVADWYSKMLKFELDNLNVNSKFQFNNYMIDKKLNYNCFFYDLKPPKRVENIREDDSYLDDNILRFLNSHKSLTELNNSNSATLSNENNLLTISNISTSQSSLASNSSTSACDLANSFQTSSKKSLNKNETTVFITAHDLSSKISESSSSSSSTSSLSAGFNQQSKMTFSESTNFSTSFSSDSVFSLEVYLNKILETKNELEINYSKKFIEYNELKENCQKLNANLNNLNDNLDMIKVENIKLNESIIGLRKQINFYAKLTRKKKNNEFFNVNYNKKNNFSLSIEIKNEDEENDEDEIDEEFKNYLEKIKEQTRREYEKYNKLQLDNYDTLLQNSFMQELDRLEQEYNEQADAFDIESNLILDELIDLNGQLAESIGEYENLNQINYTLNSRLIELSDKLCSFSKMNKDQQEHLVLNYSINDLKSRIITRKSQIKSLKHELVLVKDNLVGSDINNILSMSDSSSESSNDDFHLDIESTPHHSTESSSSSTDIAIKKPSNELLSTKILNAKRKDGQNRHKCKDLAKSYKLIPYYAQIEYTKSNLFAYFVIKFDLISNYLVSPSEKLRLMPSFSSNAIKVNKVNKNHILSSINSNSKNKSSITIRVDDSIDGSSILIENTHKILDFDLSDWTLRREIQNTVNSDFFAKNFNCELEELKKSFKSNSNNTHLKNNLFKKYTKCSSLDNLVDHQSNIPNQDVEVIQYKFPKGLRLKRRNKINLIAAGEKKAFDYTLQSQNRQEMYKCLSTNDLTNGKNTKTVSSRFLTSTAINDPQSQVTSQIRRSKCACCACKMLVTKKGDVEIFEVKEIPTWGSGLLVITKLINKKNVTKLVSYKYIKHIWVNNNNNNNNE